MALINFVGFFSMLKEAKVVSVVPLFPLPQYLVVLEDLEKTRLVPIWIGVSEGNSISLELQGEKFPRPLTHDLMLHLLTLLNASVEKVVVSDLKENSYFALIHLKHGNQTHAIDARPSDALALALKFHCPIYIDETVLQKCPEIHGPITHEEIDKFKNELKDMGPEEFFKKLEEAPPFKDNPMDQGPDTEDGDPEEGHQN